MAWHQYWHDKEQSRPGNEVPFQLICKGDGTAAVLLTGLW